MKIAIAGTGYVGLVTAVCLAHWGHQVTCVEMDEQKLALLSCGKSPIFETGVETLLQSCAERLSFTSDYQRAYRNAQILFICVGTPERGDGYANLKYVYAAAGQIADSVQNDCAVVVKSTVPIGTGDKLERMFADRLQGRLRVDVASNPEFLSQGTAVNDFLYGARMVIGAENERCEQLLKKVFAFYDGKLVVTDRRSAEMIKYASNNFLALKISYINEIANLCEIVGADVETVALGMGMDGRIGREFLRAGIGYGGSCFPKDTKALHWLAKYYDYEIKTVKAAIEVNENQKIRLIKKARKYYCGLEGRIVAVLGLAFKPQTDDLRDAPSLQIVPILLEEGADVRVWDPAGSENFKALYPHQVTYCDTIEQAVEGADLCMILTEWKQVLEFDLTRFARLMKKPIVLDGRNCYSLRRAQEAGIIYDSIGRKQVRAPR